MNFRRQTAAFVAMTIAAAALFTSCGGDDPIEKEEPAAAPALVSCSPENGATGLTGTTLNVVLTFDQNVKSTSEQYSKMSIDGGAVIEKVNAYNKDVTVSLSSLQAGTSYKLSIPEGAISGFKDNAAKAITYTFTMKEEEKPVDPDPEEGDSDRAPAQSLTNPNATKQAQNVYAYLLKNYGKKTLSGAMGGTAWETSYTDAISSVAGKYPAIVGFDYLFLNWPAKAWDGCPDYGDITPVKEAWNAGNIIQIGWHWSVPSVSGETDINKYAFYSSGTTFDIREALKEGTWQRKTIDSQIEKLAGYMKLLQEADIPVIFRPLHEAAGDYTWGSWFWWGDEGAEPCVKLWKYLRDQLQNTYGLNNLIWVWTVQTNDTGKLSKKLEDARAWYPGDDYVDIVGADLYVSKGTTQSDAFKYVNNSVKGAKMVVLSEFGNLLDFEKAFSEDAPWGYMMNWCNFEDGKPVLYCKNSDGSYSWNNTADDWKKALAGAHILNRNDIPSLK